MKINTKSEKALILSIVAINTLKNQYSKYAVTRPLLNKIMNKILFESYGYKKRIAPTTWSNYFKYAHDNKLAEHSAIKVCCVGSFQVLGANTGIVFSKYSKSAVHDANNQKCVRGETIGVEPLPKDLLEELEIRLQIGLEAYLRKEEIQFLQASKNSISQVRNAFGHIYNNGEDVKKARELKALEKMCKIVRKDGKVYSQLTISLNDSNIHDPIYQEFLRNYAIVQSKLQQAHSMKIPNKDASQLTF